MADLTDRVESNNRSSAVQDLQDSMQKLQSELLELSAALALARNLTMNGGDELPRGGSTYIRWGKNSCPDNTSLIYTGILVSLCLRQIHWSELLSESRISLSDSALSDQGVMLYNSLF